MALLKKCLFPALTFILFAVPSFAHEASTESSLSSEKVELTEIKGMTVGEDLVPIFAADYMDDSSGDAQTEAKTLATFACEKLGQRLHAFEIEVAYTHSLLARMSLNGELEKTQAPAKKTIDGKTFYDHSFVKILCSSRR